MTNEKNTNEITISQAAAVLGRKGGKAKSEAKAKAAAENGKRGGRPKKENKKMKDRKTLLEWQEEMEQVVEGTVFISCIMDEVPYHPNTKRYNVYNKEETYNEVFDITLDSDEYIIDIE